FAQYAYSVPSVTTDTQDVSNLLRQWKRTPTLYLNASSVSALPPIPLRRQEKLSWPFTGPSQRLSVKVGSRETSPVPRSFRREPVGRPTVSPRSSPRGRARKSRTA